MPYNPHIHHRRSIRLKGYDYSQAGLYFITICCEGRICRFGDVVDAEMVLNEFGTVAYDVWAKLPERFPNFELDVFLIMPNHMHGIILLNEPVGTGFTPVQNMMDTQNNGDTQNMMDIQNNGDTQNMMDTQNNEDTQNMMDTQNNGDIQNDATVRSTERVAPTIGDIVGAYKSMVANGCLDIYKSKNETMGKLWQRNYYEHIVRNESAYNRITDYIINNPAKWADDKFFKL